MLGLTAAMLEQVARGLTPYFLKGVSTPNTSMLRTHPGFQSWIGLLQCSQQSQPEKFVTKGMIHAWRHWWAQREYGHK